MLPAAEFEVDAEKRRIVHFSLLSRTFYRPQPTVSVEPGVRKYPPQEPVVRKFIPLSPADSNALFKAVLPEFTRFGQKLGLPIDFPLETNSIKSYFSELSGGSPAANVVVKNGYQLYFRRGYITGFDAPDQFFNYEWQYNGGKREDFMGPITMTVDEVAENARKEIRKLGFPEDKLHIDGKPEYKGGPYKGETNDVTRYWLQWTSSQATNASAGTNQWYVRVEFDSKTKTLKSLHISNPELRRDFP